MISDAEFQAAMDDFLTASSGVMKVTYLAQRFRTIKKWGSRKKRQRSVETFHAAGGFAALKRVVLALTAGSQSQGRQRLLSSIPGFKDACSIVSIIMHNTRPKSLLRKALVDSGVLELLMDAGVSVQDKVKDDDTLQTAIKLLWNAGRLHLNTTAAGVMTEHVSQDAAKFGSTFLQFYKADWGVRELKQNQEWARQLAAVRVFDAIACTDTGAEVLRSFNATGYVADVLASLRAGGAGGDLGVETRTALIDRCLRVLNVAGVRGGGDSTTTGELVGFTAEQEDAVVHALWHTPAAVRTNSDTVMQLLQHRLAGSVAALDAAANDADELSAAVEAHARLLYVLAVASPDAAATLRTQPTLARVLNLSKAADGGGGGSAVGVGVRVGLSGLGTRKSQALALQLRACLLLSSEESQGTGSTARSNNNSKTEIEIDAQLVDTLELLSRLLLLAENPDDALFQHCAATIVAAVARTLGDSVSARRDPARRAALARRVARAVFGDSGNATASFFQGKGSAGNSNGVVFDLLRIMRHLPTSGEGEGEDEDDDGSWSHRAVVTLAQHSIASLMELRVRRKLAELALSLIHI